MDNHRHSEFVETANGPARKGHDREALPPADSDSVCRLNPKARRQHGNVALPLRLPQ
jgi:hypothetical protein